MVSPKEQNEQIAVGIAQRLQVRERESLRLSEVDHLDADTIVAFVEGRISEPGATSITSHLIVCPACRRASARVIHLESVIPDTLETDTKIESPGTLREFISSLASRILPETEDDVVFAYEDPSSDSLPSDEPAKPSLANEKPDDKSSS